MATDKILSRVARKPVVLPNGVEFNLSGQDVTVKGPKGTLAHSLHEAVTVKQEDGQLTINLTGQGDASIREAICGTSRALLQNMVNGVSEGFIQHLTIEGTGYRAQLQGNKLNLTLGYSHPVFYEPPEGIKIEVPSQTELVISGIDKQLVGQTTAEILGFKKPNAYKRKGIFKKGQRVRLKEVKKK